MITRTQNSLPATSSIALVNTESFPPALILSRSVRLSRRSWLTGSAHAKISPVDRYSNHHARHPIN